MNSAYNNPTEILLPTSQERKQIFSYLKRISSYTAWHRISVFYQEWVEATRRCVAIASERGIDESAGIKESHYVAAIQGFSHFEEGLRRLRNGDKRVFKFDANGEFAMADRPLGHWDTYILRMFEWHEHPLLDENNTPGWTEYLSAFQAVASAWSECCLVLEARRLDKPAPLSFGQALRERLSQTRLPCDLPEVPDPQDNILVSTGRAIPCSGIWEPVDAPKPPPFSLFRQKPPKGPFAVVGCMNYLHSGSAAPTAYQETEEESSEIDVVWRLLWRDDRYEDGSIPEEEQHYEFMTPKAESSAAQSRSAAEDAKLISLASGQRATHAGRWLVEGDLFSSVTIQAGDTLPLHNGKKVRWVLANE